jgi:uncharacterized RDD family membrane protein YckC
VSANPPERPGLIARLIHQPVASVADAFVPVIVDAVDMDETLGRIDVDELLTHIDLDAVVDRIDLQALIERLDLNAVLDKLDLDALLKTVDLNELLQRVDVEQLIDRVDINAVVARVDINAIVDDVDLSAFTGKLTSAVTAGTESFLRSMLDLVRRQLVGLDLVILRFTDRLLRRQPDSLPLGPALLVASDEAETGSQVSGRYAGPVSRLLAFAVDALLIFAIFALGTSILNYLIRLVTGYHLESGSSNGIGWGIALAIWAFVYLWIGPAVAGRTFGMALVGLRVLATDGSAITQRQSFFRVLSLPLSVVLLGIGLLMAVFGKERRALHDHVGRTCVVYDWGERPAEMPAPLTKWLAGHNAIEIHTPPK